MVIDKIREIILTQENLRRLTELVNEEITKETHDYRQNFDSIETELTSVRRRLDNLYEALETKLLEVSDLAPRIKHLRQRQDSLLISKQDIEGIIANKRVELADLKTVTGYVADLKQLLVEGSLEERKVFIHSFVKEIRVTGDNVDLIYTAPLPPEHLSDSKAGVLSTVRSGRPYRSRTCDTLIKSHGVLVLGRVKANIVFLTP